MGEGHAEGTGDGLHCPQQIERESGSEPECGLAETEKPWKSSFLLVKGGVPWNGFAQERGHALDSIRFRGSGELLLALENPGRGCKPRGHAHMGSRSPRGIASGMLEQGR